MGTPTAEPARRGMPSEPRAACLVVALWAPYAAMNTLYPGPVPTYTLGMVIAGLALLALRRAGLAWDALSLRLALPSLAGAVVLALLSLYIPLTLLVGREQPWNAARDLIYAPASAVAQELYFRSALVPALLLLCRGRAVHAVGIQALLFALWHLRAYRVVPVLQATVVLGAVFAGGLAWGWQARHDRTIVYTALQHTIFLIVQ